ncbi:MAG: hypothetical protein A2Y94_12605 [Caldithrix sp. RBG_13_44_9]|nr:MAG: hypothetical protein A2Y94_12605 [Caldithrix sp. RBG_13_44_9]
MACKNAMGSFVFIIFLMLLFGSCDTGIEDSPDPGILRITLESDQSDTVIVIVTDTLTVSDDDILLMSIFQGRVFQDSTYGVLYPTISSTRQEEIFYNLILRESGQYKRFTIFETYVPPGFYNRIEYGIDSRFLKLKNFDLIEVITPDNYFLKLPTSFEVKSNGITEVNVSVKPFQYIIRYRDIYLFQPEMEVVGINHL